MGQQRILLTNDKDLHSLYFVTTAVRELDQMYLDGCACITVL